MIIPCSLSYHPLFAHTTTLSDHTTKSLPLPTCNVDDSSAAISVNGYEDRLNTSTGGQKAILAISEDNESAVIKYRSDQDMSSIGEYQDSSSKGSFQSSHFFRIDHPVAILILVTFSSKKKSQSELPDRYFCILNRSYFGDVVFCICPSDYVCFCPNIFSAHYVFAGPSKSLTFEEGLVGNGEAGAGTESEAPKKVPDPCCPIFCERM